MYSDRTCYNELILLLVWHNEDAIKKFVASFNEELKATRYYCSVGYAARKDDGTPVEELLKESEKLMYKDKAEFYKKANIERRKVGYIEE